jgi:hypothetical protein
MLPDPLSLMVPDMADPGEQNGGLNTVLVPSGDPTKLLVRDRSLDSKKPAIAPSLLILFGNVSLISPNDGGRRGGSNDVNFPSGSRTKPKAAPAPCHHECKHRHRLIIVEDIKYEGQRVLRTLRKKCFVSGRILFGCSKNSSV